MCGIVGYISHKSLDISKNLESIKHRGPDHTGYKEYDCSGMKIGFGHNRLSIIDLDKKANQPFEFFKKYSLIYNGEIYNYLELRDYLISKGYSFITKSDTEVLISCYDYFGDEFLKYLDGMFAFAIFDKVKSRLIIARDHIGIKPIYYHYSPQDNNLFFGSELKSLFLFKKVPKQICKEMITEFLFNGWLYEPDTGFKEVIKIPPGCFLDYHFKEKNIRLIKYFDISDTSTFKKIDNKIEDLIDQSIEKQCRSDVSLGAYFSGGVDSSIIVSKIKKIKCLSASYDKKSLVNSGMGNDYEFVKKIKKILDLKVEKVTLEDKEISIDSLKTIVEKIEELNADFTYRISEKISKAAQNKNFKVMLSGMGADELFGGYPRYRLTKFRIFFKFIKLILIPLSPFFRFMKSLNKKIERFNSFLDEEDFALSYSSLVGSFSFNEIYSLVKDKNSLNDYKNKINNLLDNVRDQTSFKKAFYLDIYGFLSHNFIIGDKSSMQASIEMRVPLANKELLIKNFYEQENNLLNIFSNKIQLKKILYSILPRNIVNRKKTGFNPPLDNLINSYGEENIRILLLNSKLTAYLEKDPILKILSNHFCNVKNNTYKIWQLIYLALWLDYAETR